MRELVLVLNVKAHILLKNLFDLRFQSVVKNLSSLIIFGGVAVGVFFLSRLSTLYLIQEAHIGQFLYHRFLSMLLYVFFVTVNLGNMIVCYATMFKSDEVKFLMGLPISHEKIFLLKFVDNFFYSSTTLTLLGLSWLLGYGSTYNMPWTFYFVAMFLVFLPFMLISGLLAVLILMGMIKVAARVGIRLLLAALVGVYLLVVYLYFQMTNPVQLVQEVMKYYPDVNQYFGYLDAPASRFLPNHWVSEFLYWSVRGEPEAALPWFFILVLVMLALMIIAALLAHKYYYTSWLSASDTQSFRLVRSRALRFRFLQLAKAGRFERQLDVMMKRDFWMFFREPSQWLHLMLMSALLLVFLVSLSALELRLTQPLLQTTSFLVVFLFNGFLVASLLLRFVFPAISLEGEPFWCVRSAPVSLRKLYLFKMVIALVLVVAIAESLVAASTYLLRSDPVLVRFVLATMGSIAVGLTGLNLGAGAYFAAYREKNPIRIASSQGASLTFLASMSYLSFCAMIIVLPLKRYFDNLILRGWLTTDWMVLPIVLVAVLSVVVFVVSTGVGLRAFHRDF
jgi:ABC-2 type transport system permease protein